MPSLVNPYRTVRCNTSPRLTCRHPTVRSILNAVKLIFAPSIFTFYVVYIFGSFRTIVRSLLIFIHHPISYFVTNISPTTTKQRNWIEQASKVREILLHLVGQIECFYAKRLALWPSLSQ